MPLYKILCACLRSCPCPFYLYPHSNCAADVTLLAYFIETSIIMISQTQKPHRSPIPRHLKLSLTLTSVSFPSGMVLALYSWYLHDVTSLFVHCQASAFSVYCYSSPVNQRRMHKVLAALGCFPTGPLIGPLTTSRY